MRISECLDQRQWNTFVLNQPSCDGLFLQSWEWGEIKKAEGRTIRRLVIEDEGKIQAVGFFIQEPLPLGFYYWYCPRGPVGNIKLLNYEIAKLLIQEFQNDKKCLFLRLEWPRATDVESEMALLKAGGVRPELMMRSQSPNTTLVLDLTKSETELLAAMKPKARYNIKVAERHGVVIEETNDFPAFWRLLESTSDRQQFNLHSRSHYEKILELLPGTRLCFARYQDKIVAAYLMVSFGSTVTYLHGATNPEYRAVMAPYLLQWEEIKKAKRDGARQYDFWGINSFTRTGYPTLVRAAWEGFTRFKLGFGGQVIEYPGAYDFVVHSGWYRGLVMLKNMNPRKLFFR